MGAERREFERADLKVPVRYRPLKDVIELWYPGTMLNLSASGLRLAVEDALELGTSVEIEIPSPGRKDSYTIFGEIRSELRAAFGYHEYGVSFVDVTPDKQAELDELVRFLMK